MVVEGGSYEKDLKLVGREVQSRGEELRKERSDNFKFGGDGWYGATEVVRGASFTSGFDINEITQLGWFGFMKGIVSNGYDFVLCALFGLDPVRRFQCRIDV